MYDTVSQNNTYVVAKQYLKRYRLVHVLALSLLPTNNDRHPVDCIHQHVQGIQRCGLERSLSRHGRRVIALWRQ